MIGDEAWIESALAALVSTSSLSGREAAAQEVVKRLMLEAGADSVRMVPVDAALLQQRYGFKTPTPTEGMFAVVGAWGEPAASPFVLLNGHIDTVPATAGWAIDPLEPRVTDGWMNGLGSADMKAGVVGAIAGVARAKAAGTLRGYVEVQSVPDEEDGGGTGTLACVHELLNAGTNSRLRNRLRADAGRDCDGADRQPRHALQHSRRPGTCQHEACGRQRRRGRDRPGAANCRAGPQMPHRSGASAAGAGLREHRPHATAASARPASRPTARWRYASPTIRPTRPLLIPEIDALIAAWRARQNPAITMEVAGTAQRAPILDGLRTWLRSSALARALGGEAVDPRGFPGRLGRPADQPAARKPDGDLRPWRRRLASTRSTRRSNWPKSSPMPGRSRNFLSSSIRVELGSTGG